MCSIERPVDVAMYMYVEMISFKLLCNLFISMEEKEVIIYTPELVHVHAHIGVAGLCS